MVISAQVVRVLIASPGDVALDRSTIRDAINDWNADHAIEHAVVFLPVMWETHCRPTLGARPQAILNGQFVNDVDLVIAVFRGRLGTPTGVAESGTLEEINFCMQKNLRVAVYFSSEGTPLDSIDVAQVAKLQQFKAEVKRQGIIGEYRTSDDLGREVTKQLFVFARKVSRPAQANAHDGRVEIYNGELRKLAASSGIGWQSETCSWSPRVIHAREILRQLRDRLTHMFGDYCQHAAPEETERLQVLIARVVDLIATPVEANSKSKREFWSTGDKVMSDLIILADGPDDLPPVNPPPPLLRIDEVEGRNCPGWTRGRNGHAASGLFVLTNVSSVPIRFIGVDVELHERGRTRLKHKLYLDPTGSTDENGSEIESTIPPGASLTFGITAPCRAVEPGADVCMLIYVVHDRGELATRIWFGHRSVLARVL